MRRLAGQLVDPDETASLEGKHPAEMAGIRGQES